MVFFLMAKSVNRAFLLGNVGKDPEIRATGGGTQVANFGLATTERTKDQQGNYQDRTEWHNIVAYGKLAEIVRDYVTKGSKIFVEGKLQTRNWDDKEHPGRKVYRTEIIISEITLLSAKNGNGEGGGNGASNGDHSSNSYGNNQGYNQNQSQGQSSAATTIDDSDIPF